MAYITQLKLNTRNDIIRNPSVMHAMIARALDIPVYSGKNGGETGRRYLWRIDVPIAPHVKDRRVDGAKGGAIPPGERLLTIISDQKPKLGALINNCGDGTLSPDSACVCRDYSEDVESYKRATVYNFRLTANPTKALFAGAVDKRGHVRGLTKTKEQLNWLFEQGKKNGFVVLNGTRVVFTTVRKFDGNTRTVNRQTGNKPTHHPNGLVEIRTCTYVGRLVVTDPEKLKQALIQGIGPCKAYGQGLLTLTATT